MALAAIQIDRTLIGDRIKELRVAAGLTQAGLADLIDRARKRIDPKLGCSRAAVGQWEINKSKPEYDMVESIAHVLDTSPAYIAFGLDTATKVDSIETIRDGLVFVKEITFGDTPEDRKEVRQWGLPADLVKEAVGESKNHFIMALPSNALRPEYSEGDSVFVDASDKRPTGAGAFAYWDGMGVAVGYMQVIPGKKPKLKITGEGVRLNPLNLDDVVIIGKIKGRFALG